MQCLVDELPASSSATSQPTRACNAQVKKFTNRNSRESWIEFLEVGGQYHHPQTNLCFYKRFDAIIGVFDLTDPSSFGKLDDVLAPALDFRMNNQPVVVIGTRNDLFSSSGFYSNNRQSHQSHPYYHRLTSLGIQVLGVSLLEPPDLSFWNSFYNTVLERMQSHQQTTNTYMSNGLGKSQYTAVKID